MSWVESPGFAYEEAIDYCELCGRPIRGRSWHVEVAGAIHRFCDESCEARYRDYWLPRYGSEDSGTAL